MAATRRTLLGVPLDSVTQTEAVDLLRVMLDTDRQHHVMTPNSEMLVEGYRNPRFLEVLQHSSLNLPDSQGVVWFGKLPQRVTGVDTVRRLCAVLDERTSVFLLGAAPGVADKAAAALRARNPQLTIAGTFAGSPRADESADIIARIHAASPRLLLVAFGAPAQDLWINAHLRDLPSVRVAMGVGGTFDFLAGVRKRAPRWMQSLGLEWLWRLLREPRRIGRIWNAVVVFPWLVLTRGETPRR